MTKTENVRPSAREQSRARYPDRTGYVERDGVRVFWEQYGEGEPAILFLPTWSIVHSRVWKAQIPYFARYTRVLTFDPRGNGRSGRPLEPAAYDEAQFAADALAVMDATRTQSALLVGLSIGSHRGLLLAAEHPERVSGICFIGAGTFLGPVLATPVQCIMRFDEPRESYEGWDRFSRGGWERDFPGFMEFFFGQVVVEAHSTKQIEDSVEWGLETTPEALMASIGGEVVTDRTAELCAQLRCPVLIAVGSDDRITPPAISEALASETGGRLLVFEGSGHSPHTRDPVRFNLELRDFAQLGRHRSRTWQRAHGRGRRALYVSSPIGLGHAWRDVAIARELRRLVPDLEIEWLAQDPVTRVLEGEGEHIHPASAQLASEATHIDSESREHELNAFETYRRMDEILIANFMLFHDVVDDEDYDLWIGDEAWELDYFLHENPECKRARIRVADGLCRVAADDRGRRTRGPPYRRLQRGDDRADRPVPACPRPRDLHRQPRGRRTRPLRPRACRRSANGQRSTSRSPGTSQASLGRRQMENGAPYEPSSATARTNACASSAPVARASASTCCAGSSTRTRSPPSACQGCARSLSQAPRIAPDSLGHPKGVEVVGYIHDLHRHLAVCDVAVVHGGLATTMELTAARRPFTVLPAQTSLRAAAPRSPPARALRGGSLHGHRHLTTRCHRRRDCRPTCPRASLPAGRDERRTPRRRPDRRAAVTSKL